MNPHDPEAVDQRLADLLAAYDRTLTEGATSLSEQETPIDEEILGRLQGAKACLDRLERRWPRSEPSSLADLLSGSNPSALSRGPVWFGRFRILRELGRGGCGIVFLAFDPTLRRPVALKVPRPEVLVLPEMRRRFLREGRMAAGLDHRNIISVFEANEEGPIPYIAQAYCAGPTLDEWLKQQTDPVPASIAANLITTLASAVQHAHSHHVFHRDLKPANVLLSPPQEDESGRVRSTDGLVFIPKLTDFGLAKALKDEQEKSLQGEAVRGREIPAGGETTRTGALIGTARYMAPELAENVRKIGPGADVYALGVILYELLIGRPPFLGATDLAILRQVLSDEPVPPRRLRPDVPADLEAVCLKCLEKEPRRRYATAQALADDLRRFLNNEATQARPIGPVGRTLKWARRQPAAAALVAVSALALLAMTLGTSWYVYQQDKHNRELEDRNVDLRATATREEQQRKLAEQRERQLRRKHYADQSRWAIQDLEKGRLLLAVERLNDLRAEPGQEELRGFEWHYLKGLCHPLHTVWRGHQSDVIAVTVSPDGKTVASGGSDGTIRLWNTATGQARTFLIGHTTGVESLAFSPDGRTLAFTKDAEPGIIHLWDVATKSERIRLNVAVGGYQQIAFAPDGQTLAVSIVTGFGVWDCATGKQRAYYPVDSVHHLCLAYAPCGQTIALGTSHGRIRLCDVATGHERVSLDGHVQGVWSVAFSSNGRSVASGSADGTVRLWDAATGSPKAVLKGHRHSVIAVAISPDGRIVASAASNHKLPNDTGEVKLWDMATGNLLASFDRYVGRVNSLAFLPDSQRLVVGCADRTVKLLDTHTAPQTGILTGHTPKEVWGLAFSPDGRTLASAGDDEHVRLWDPATGLEKALLRGHRSLVTAVAFSRNGQIIASGSFDMTVNLWDAATGKLRTTLTGAKDKVRCVAVSPNSGLIAAGGDDQMVRLWRTNTGEELAPLAGHGRKVRSVAFAPDGETLASAGEDSKIRLWETSTWQLRRQFDDTEQVGNLTFSPDGKTLASVNKAGIVRLWDLATGQEQVALKGHIKEIFALAFSPDGKTLATAGEDKTVRLWQVSTGEELLNLEGHDSRVNAVAFAPDGRTLASADHEGLVRLWRTTAPVVSSSVSPERRDVPFGRDGLVATAVGRWASAHAVAVQLDGKIVVAGYTRVDDKNTDFLVLRYLVDGTLDPTFGKNGWVTTDLGPNDVIHAVAIQPDGKIVAAGTNGGRFALARYNTDGNLDTTFGNGGHVTTDLGGHDVAYCLAFQPWGKILVGGEGISGSPRSDDFILARYLQDGTLDPHFGEGGNLRTDIASGAVDVCHALAFQSDGKIVAAGIRSGPGKDDFALARYLKDGPLDPNFISAGVHVTSFSGNFDQATGLVVQQDHKLLIAGLTRTRIGYDFALMRLLGTGTPDEKFGSKGKVSTLFSAHKDVGFVRLAVQPDGKLVLAGSTGDRTHPFALVRYTSEGRPDTTFGKEGLVSHPSASDAGPDTATTPNLTSKSGNDWGCGLTLQSDGKIVVVGHTFIKDNMVIAVARYRRDGRPDGQPVKAPSGDSGHAMRAPD